MNRIKRDSLDEDDKNLDTITQLRSLIKKAIKESRDAHLERKEKESESRVPKHREQTKASLQRTSLTAVFKIAGLKALGKLAFEKKI